MKIEERDEEERALVILLWGKKGWEGYKSLTHRGFSIQRLLEFFRTREEARDPS
ncbi:MAG: hypothetical protein GTN81_16845 [Proteobacteria bacterium]|nr:hypothetical protein [Pseudomonadota bacterium]